jgi:hypothetical protein
LKTQKQKAVLPTMAFPLIVFLLPVMVLLLIISNEHFVLGQGCTNTCPPINFGVVIPALCEGDFIDSDGDGVGVGGDENNVKADVDRVYDVCYPTINNNQEEGEENLSFKFSDFSGPSNTVTVIANYYTGCGAGRRESG